MSHFTVMVIGDDPERQLAPFEEDLPTKRYVEYTKQQLIDKERAEIEEYKNGNYAEYLADPEKYLAKCSEGHAKFIQNEFPERLTWTDEQVYQHALRWYEPEQIGEDGEVYSERNPNAKWDWYSLGGRWSGMIKLKNGARGIKGRPGVFDNKVGIDAARKGDIANFDELRTFAIVKDGEWYERGEMGWWGIVSNEKAKEEWEEEFKKAIEALPDDTLISIFDCHI